MQPDLKTWLNACAGQASRAAFKTFKVVELLRRYIGDGEVCQINLVGSPIRSASLPIRHGHHCAAEESQLEAKAAAILSLEIAGIVPPLGLEVGVWTKGLRECDLWRAFDMGIITRRRCRRHADHLRLDAASGLAKHHPPGQRAQRGDQNQHQQPAHGLIHSVLPPPRPYGSYGRPGKPQPGAPQSKPQPGPAKTCLVERTFARSN